MITNGVYVPLPLTKEAMELFYSRPYTGDPTEGIKSVGLEVTEDVPEFNKFSAKRYSEGWKAGKLDAHLSYTRQISDRDLLLREFKEKVGALLGVISSIDPDWRNGATDSTGSIDEGEAVASVAITELERLVSKSEVEVPKETLALEKKVRTLEAELAKKESRITELESKIQTVAVDSAKEALSLSGWRAGA